MSARLLICGFSAFPDAIRNPAQASVEALAAEGWSPLGAQADFLTVPVVWRGSAETILQRLVAEPADAVLVVGVAVGVLQAATQINEPTIPFVVKVVGLVVVMAATGHFLLGRLVAFTADLFHRIPHLIG